MLKRVGDHRRVVHQIGVREHHSLGSARRARSVLEERQRFAVYVGTSPTVGQALVALVGRSPTDLLQGRRFADHRLHTLQNVEGGQRDLCLRVVGDRIDPSHVAIAARRISWHRSDSCIQTAKKRRHKIQARGVEQQGPLAFEVHRLKRGRDRARFSVDIGIGPLDGLFFAIEKKTKAQIVALMQRPMLQKFDQVGGAKEGAGKVVEMHARIPGKMTNDRMTEIHKR